MATEAYKVNTDIII